MNFLLNFTLQPCIYRGVLFFIMALRYAQGDNTSLTEKLSVTTQHPEVHILRQHQFCRPDRPIIPCAHVFPRRAEESDVSLPLNMTRVAPTACRPLPCHPDRLSFLAHLSRPCRSLRTCPASVVLYAPVPPLSFSAHLSSRA